MPFTEPHNEGRDRRILQLLTQCKVTTMKGQVCRAHLPVCRREIRRKATVAVAGAVAVAVAVERARDWPVASGGAGGHN